jgi:DNA-binding CsgD family transcriptional regulator
MMLQRTFPDERMAAVARLTAKERECLTRWLGHATAKEIAIDLGITHHAVEKRLKSARAKLGVTSTLDAARLLASSGDYQATASQSSELAARCAESEEPVAAAVAMPDGQDRRRSAILEGVSIMSLITLVALAITTPATSPEVVPKPQVIELQGGATIDLDNPAAATFASLDRNRNDLLESAETKDGTLSLERAADGGVHMSPLTKENIAAFDGNKDGLVTRAEFEAGFAVWAKNRS